MKILSYKLYFIITTYPFIYTLITNKLFYTQSEFSGSKQRMLKYQAKYNTSFLLRENNNTKYEQSIKQFYEYFKNYIIYQLHHLGIKL